MEKSQILGILKQEMVTAMGCTEPAASALAGAKATELLGTVPEQVHIFASRDMIKNAMGVGIPNCSICGIQAAVCLGICIGEPSLGLNILSEVTEQQQHQAVAIMPSAQLEMVCGVHPVYIRVLVQANGKTAECTVSLEHNKFTSLKQDGVELQAVQNDLPKSKTGASETPVNAGELSIHDILTFVSSAEFPKIQFVLDGARTNLDLAEHSIKNSYGLLVGKTALEEVPEQPCTLLDAILRGAGLAAGASDARMSGCARAVVINSGSGNQGITCSVPVFTMAQFLQCSQIHTARALCVSQLVALSLTARKERLSALCGAFTAAIGTGCGFAYLMGGGENEMDMIIRTMVANLTGMVCDGAKTTCALKIYSSIIAAGLSCKLAFKGSAPGRDSGIVGGNAAETVDHLVRVCHEGMLETDKTILSIMLDVRK